MNIELVPYYILLLGALAIVYMLGMALTALFQLRAVGYFQHFLRLCFGLSVSVAAYAILATRGNTVMLLLLLALLAVGLTLRKRQPEENIAHETSAGLPFSVSLPQLCLLLGMAAAFVFIIRLPSVVDVSGATTGVPYHDYVFYSRLTYPLSQLGVETPIIDPVYGHLLIAQPYHYYEIWLNNLLVAVSGWPSLLVLNLVAYPVLLVVVLLGFAAIAEFYLRSKWLILALALGALFFTNVGIPFISVKFIQNFMLGRTPPLPFHPKEAPAFLFILLGFAFYQRKRLSSAAWAWACVPVVYISTWPGLGLSLVVLGAYLVVRGKLTFARALSLVGPIVAVSVGIVLFYGLNSLRQTEASTVRSFTEYVVKPNELATAFNVLVGTSIGYFLFYALYILLLAGLLLTQRRNLAAYFQKNETNLVFAALAYGSTLVVSTILYHYVDATQFMSNLLLPVLAVVMLILLCTALAGASRRVQLLGVAGLWVIVGGDLLLTKSRAKAGYELIHYSNSFVAKVKRLAPKLSQTGAFINADQYYTSAMKFHTGGQTPGLYLSLFRNNQVLISLSQLDINNVLTDPRFARDSTYAMQSIEQSTIYRFVEKQKKKGEYISLDQTKKSILLQERINFICLSAEAEVPILLQPLVRTVLVDPVSKEKLCLLYD